MGIERRRKEALFFAKVLPPLRDVLLQVGVEKVLRGMPGQAALYQGTRQAVLLWWMQLR